MNEPLVSVVLPVYNCEKYVQKSIASILEQSFSNFELIIINDGSTDNSESAIFSIDDPRIRYFKQENLGLSLTLNRGIALAKGKYIARQDQDDISMPDRLKLQVDLLERSPSIGMVGTSATIIEQDTITDRQLAHPTANNDIQFFLCFNNCFVHTSVMIRKSLFEIVGLYSSEKDHQPEDYDLWLRLSQHTRLANLAEQLVMYREVLSSMSRVQKELFPNVPQLAAGRLNSDLYGLFSEATTLNFCRLMYGKMVEVGFFSKYLMRILMLFLLFRYRPSIKLWVRSAKSLNRFIEGNYAKA